MKQKIAFIVFLIFSTFFVVTADAVTFSGSSGINAKVDVKNIVTNGTFDSDTIWNKQAGWTISDGKASCDGTQASRVFINQGVGLKSSTKYRLRFDLTVTAGYFSIGDATPTFSCQTQHLGRIKEIIR